MRSQFTHVIDVAPTVLEAAHLPHPSFVHGIQQAPLEGVSMAYSFDDAATRRAASDAVLRGVRQPRHLPQGLDRGHPSLRRRGAQQGGLPALDDDVWELYTPDDWTQARDVAADNPDKLRDLQRLFLLEAGKYNVFPLDDRRYERFNSDLAGRPQLVKGNTQVLFGGMGRLSENSVINIKNKSHAVTADLTVPAGGASGVIIAQGGQFGGWVLYVHDGKPAYCYNLLGVQQFTIYGDTELTPGRPPGADGVRLRRRRPRQGRHRQLFIDGTAVGEGRVDATQPMIFSADETTDIGSDSATPVSDDYTAKNSTFTGRVRRVQIDLGDDANDADHLHLTRRALPHRRRHPIGLQPQPQTSEKRSADQNPEPDDDEAETSRRGRAAYLPVPSSAPGREGDPAEHAQGQSADPKG